MTLRHRGTFLPVALACLGLPLPGLGQGDPTWGAPETGPDPALRGPLAPLAPGDVVVGSRGTGAVFASPATAGLPGGLISGAGAPPGSPVRGGGPDLAVPGGHLALLAMGDGRVLARIGDYGSWGLYAVNVATGDRALLPGTNGAQWASTSNLIAIDPDTVLVIADDFPGGWVGTGRILRYRLSTGQTTVVSGSGVGTGVRMHRPRALARVDEGSIAVVELGPLESGGSAPGAILFRVDLATGNRSVVSTLTDEQPLRSVPGAVELQPVALRGAGPTVTGQCRGLAVINGSAFVACSLIEPYAGAIIQVDLTTGDRTLVGGAALVGGVRTERPFAASSTATLPDSPTGLIARSNSSVVLTSTFGPNKVWTLDVATRRLDELFTFDDSFYLTSGLAVVPSPCLPDSGVFSFAQQPMSVSGVGCPATASFTVGAAPASSGPFNYQWETRVGAGPWVPLTNGALGTATVSGATAPTLTLTGPGAIRRDVRCVVSTLCTSAPSAAATYAACPADYNCTNGVDLLDIFAFLAHWFAGNPRADFNANGAVEIIDIFQFLAAWFTGC